MAQELWRCPVCGQTLVTRNMPHSCEVVPIESHFARSEPHVREIFDALLAAVQENGPVTVNSTKSRISFQVLMRFGGVDAPRRRHLVANFVLTRPVSSPRLARVDHFPPRYWVHRVRLDAVADVDEELHSWLAEAYRVGLREHVSR